MHTKPLYMTAALTFDAAQDDPQLPRRFSGIAYSGGAVNDWGEQVVIDLDSTSLAPQMPLLFQHDHTQVIGTISVASVADGTLHVSGELFSDIDETAKSVAAKSLRGAAYQMSVGLFDASRENAPLGRQVYCNGKSFNGPAVVLRNGTIREVSVVALGADAHTQADFFNQKTQKEFSTMPTIEELQGKVSELETALAEKTAVADAATAQLAAQAADARTTAVKELFAACSKEFTEESAAPFVAMEASQFAAVSATMTELAAKTASINPALFSQQVTGGQEQQQKPVTLSLTDHYALRKKFEQGA
jgi:hypothetical protein